DSHVVRGDGEVRLRLQAVDVGGAAGGEAAVGCGALGDGGGAVDVAGLADAVEDRRGGRLRREQVADAAGAQDALGPAQGLRGTEDGDGDLPALRRVDVLALGAAGQGREGGETGVEGEGVAEAAE